MVREGEILELGSNQKDFICSSRRYINFYIYCSTTYTYNLHTYSIIEHSIIL